MFNEGLRVRGREVLTRQEANYSLRQIFKEENKAWVSGVIEQEFTFSHNVERDKYYQTRVKVARLSGNFDYVPIIVSESVLPKEFDNVKDKYIEVGGELRSYAYHGEEGKTHTKLFIYGKIVNICDKVEELLDDFNVNIIYAQGYICKQPFYRKTLREKDITDIMIAINRKDGRTFFAPCIAWEKNAFLMKYFPLGQKLELLGRFQSRDYLKKHPDMSVEKKIAYEVSIIKVKKMEKYAE